MKRISITLTVLIIALFSGCGKKDVRDQIKPGSYIYGKAHIFAETSDDEDFAQVHLYNNTAAQFKNYYGPEIVTIARGKEKDTLYLDLQKIVYKKRKEVATYNLSSTYFGKHDSVGKLTISYDDYSYETSISIKVKNKYKLETSPVFTIGAPEVLIVDNQYRFEQYQKHNLKLIGSLYTDLEYDGRAASDENLMLFLYLCKDATKVDFSQIEEWESLASPDGLVHTFRVWYSNGGNGDGSYYPVEIMHYQHDGINHVKDGYADFIFDEDDDSLGNFNYIEKEIIYSWDQDKDNDTIYLIEQLFYDSHPKCFDENCKFLKNTYSVLIAFKFDNGRLKPAKVFKAKNELLNHIVVPTVDSVDDAPHYRILNAQGKLGVPLIESSDYCFHGKYLIYEWNPKSGLFEYNGKKERL